MSDRTIRYARSRALSRPGPCQARLPPRRAKRGAMGQPPYDPADLLKLYLYGYINQVRSSRRLEREASRNLELIWLLRNLRPGYRTIANFRKENWAALKAVNRRLRASRTRAWACRWSACCDRRLVLSWRCQQGKHLYAQEARRTDRRAGPGDRGLRHVEYRRQRCSGRQRAEAGSHQRSGRGRRRRWWRYRRQSIGADGEALARAIRFGSA